jgi:aminoglycoside phosphotransferase (APT) family kinase protein
LSFTKAAPESIDIGDLERTYAVIREIGRGGMGAVVLARHRESGHRVAIKIAATAKFDAEALARFQREARLMASFHHPNIVRLYDVCQIGGGRVGIVMEYVKGVSLARLLSDKKRLSFAEIEAILRDLGHALAHAHSQGVVHRDVKPHNVLVEQETSKAKLSDFGIAKVSGDQSEVTAVGAVLGTPAYMSPEQIAGRDIDGRSDVYGLGVLGWEMITGERPWAGEGLYHLLHKQQHEDLPPLTHYRPDTPASLQLALEGALEKDRDLRWSSVADMVSQLGSAEPTAAMLERRTRVEAWRAAQAIPDEATTQTIHRRPRVLVDARHAEGGTLPNAGAVATPPVPDAELLAPVPEPVATEAPYVRPKWMLPALFGLGTIVGGLLTLLVVRQFTPATQPAPRAARTSAPADSAARRAKGGTALVAGSSSPAGTPAPTLQATRNAGVPAKGAASLREPLSAPPRQVESPVVAPATDPTPPAVLDRRAAVYALATRARADLYAGNLDRAGRYIDSALALDPRSGSAYLVRARLRIGRGEVRDAWTDIELAARTGAKWEALALTTMLKSRELGPREARERLTPELRAALTPRRVLDAEHAVALAVALAQVRDTSTALTLLELASNDSRLPELLADPLLAPLHRSARFTRLRQSARR